VVAVKRFKEKVEDREKNLSQMTTVELFIVKPYGSATKPLPGAVGKSLKKYPEKKLQSPTGARSCSGRLRFSSASRQSWGAPQLGRIPNKNRNLWR
jgi:hypothetical protein